MRTTHTKFVRLTNNSHSFITGVTDKCEHDFSESVFFLANGDVLREKDYRCPTDEATLEYIYKVAENRNTHVSGGSVSCSRCGRYITEYDIIMNGD